ncbi:uncharacterized protein LOC114713687 [Neltuma alba]|uniref:uncharacterized protein LOC114713687 n=1 Tax=Neltuma alba TaxID=207710 RepID=UPI0010A59FE3|nr:uncharacterized protein LOC114713687 [Prosopis alba]
MSPKPYVLENKDRASKIIRISANPDFPEQKWDRISMGSIVGLPCTSSNHDVTWVIVDQLTSWPISSQLKLKYLPGKFAGLYVKEFVRLYGVPKDIMSDRDARFMSRFWKDVRSHENPIESQYD